VWYNSTSEETAVVHQFKSSDPEMNHAPHISAKFLAFKCFWLMYTNEILNILVVETYHYYHHIQG
jgi:hypothetical protein